MRRILAYWTMCTGIEKYNSGQEIARGTRAIQWLYSPKYSPGIVYKT